MSFISHLFVLAFASTVLASPHAHGHGHGHRHLRRGAGAPYPMPSANGTAPQAANTAAGISTSETILTTVTDRSTRYETIYRTVSIEYASSGTPAVSAADQSASGACGNVVTVTSTQNVYVTVTAGSAPSASSAAATASESLPAPSMSSSSSGSMETAQSSPDTSVPDVTAVSSAPHSSPASASVTQSSSSSLQSASASTESAPASKVIPIAQASSSSSAGSASAAPSPSTTSSAEASKEAGNTTPTTASSAAQTSSSGSKSGKRGLGYNDANLLSCFDGSNEVTWAYNWGSSSQGLTGFSYIPTLWGNEAVYTNSWLANAKSAIGSGSTHLFSFNEPDLSTQSNLSPSAAAAAYKTNMNQFAGQAKLCAPAVTNGVGTSAAPMGIPWLKEFQAACSGCTIDCYNFHWYDSASNVDYFKEYITNATTLAGDKPIFISEFGGTGSNDQINSFLKEVMPWMDSNEQISGYAYYMAASGLLLTGTEPSTYGSTYKSYT